MDELFGVSMTTIAMVLAVFFGIGLSVLLYINLRNPILVRMAVRNVTRRPAQSFLIVIGLMLATMIITSAFTTGDSITSSIKEIATKDLNNLDQFVRVDDESDIWEGLAVPQEFDQALFDELGPILEADPDIDAVLPSLNENVAVVNLETKQFEVTALLTGVDPQRAPLFNDLRTVDGLVVSIAGLGRNELYIDVDGARELGAKPGSTLAIAVGPETFVNFTVKGITDGFYFRPVGTDVSLMLSLERAQELAGKEGKLSSILVSNRGGVQDGAAHTGAVQSRLADIPALRDNGLELFPLKARLIDIANDVASIFVTIFTLFGSFSIGVGILLIFLIFSMLAAERKSEMGVARAIGMSRSHLVQMFIAEGAVYSLGAAVVGVVLGVGVGFLLVYGVSEAFATGAPDADFRLTPAVSVRSVLVSFFAGSVVTFGTVAIASWRISRLNIVRAIRDIPEPELQRAGRSSLIWGIILAIFGALFAFFGYNAAQLTLFGLGASLLPLGVALMLRYRGVSQRIVLNIVGVYLLIFWLLPPAFFDSMRDDWSQDFSIFFVSSFLVITGAVLVTMNNPVILTTMSTLLVSRFRMLAPMVKSAVAYPLRNTFRTGLSVAMFAVVIFSIIVMSVVTFSFQKLFDNEERLAGGYQVVASVGGQFTGRTNILNPVEDPAAIIQRNPDLDFVRRKDGQPSIGSLRTIFDAEAKFPEEGIEAFEETLITGVNDDFFATNSFQISLATAEFKDGDRFDARAVWDAVQQNPRLAVVSATLVPSRNSFQFGVFGDRFMLNPEGLFIENDVMDPIPVTLRDLESGEVFEVTVIGVIDTAASFFFLPPSIYTSTETLQSFLPEDPEINTVFFHVEPDTLDAANRIEAAFFSFGLESVDIEKSIDDSQAANLAFNNLLTAFMALGLVVGIASLGVISARAVVERRHQIGVLRAIGFSRRMVLVTFLMESSFIAILGIVLGVGLGLITSVNIASDIGSDEPDFQIVIPWARFALIAGGAYLISWLTTWFPARSASRVDPADALRYE